MNKLELSTFGDTRSFLDLTAIPYIKEASIDEPKLDFTVSSEELRPHIENIIDFFQKNANKKYSRGFQGLLKWSNDTQILLSLMSDFYIELGEVCARKFSKNEDLAQASKILGISISKILLQCKKFIQVNINIKKFYHTRPLESVKLLTINQLLDAINQIIILCVVWQELLDKKRKKIEDVYEYISNALYHSTVGWSNVIS